MFWISKDDSKADDSPLVVLRKCFSKRAETIYITNTLFSFEVSVSLRRNLLEEAD